MERIKEGGGEDIKEGEGGGIKGRGTDKGRSYGREGGGERKLVQRSHVLENLMAL